MGDKSYKDFTVMKAANGWIVRSGNSYHDAPVTEGMHVFTKFSDLCVWLGEQYGQTLSLGH